MEVQRRDCIIGELGDFQVEGLPFDPGQAVEVIVVPKVPPLLKTQVQNLRGSVLEYRDPLDPVASEAWEALR